MLQRQVTSSNTKSITYYLNRVMRDGDIDKLVLFRNENLYSKLDYHCYRLAAKYGLMHVIEWLDTIDAIKPKRISSLRATALSYDRPKMAKYLEERYNMEPQNNYVREHHFDPPNDRTATLTTNMKCRFFNNRKYELLDEYPQGDDFYNDTIVRHVVSLAGETVDSIKFIHVRAPHLFDEISVFKCAVKYNSTGVISWIINNDYPHDVTMLKPHQIV